MNWRDLRWLRSTPHMTEIKSVIQEPIAKVPLDYQGVVEAVVLHLSSTCSPSNKWPALTIWKRAERLVGYWTCFPLDMISKASTIKRVKRTAMTFYWSQDRFRWRHYSSAARTWSFHSVRTFSSALPCLAAIGSELASMLISPRCPLSKEDLRP